MKEIHQIIQAYDMAVAAGRKVALASVVHLEGSSYRRPGARMLVTDEGDMTGAISGGCLEGDALRKAQLALSQGRSRLVTYDTSDEEDATIGVQLGCAGIIQVLFEPIDTDRVDHPIQLLRKAAAVRQNAVLVTLFSLEDKRGEQAGTCFLEEASGETWGQIPYPGLEPAIRDDVETAMNEQSSFFRQYPHGESSITAFIECLQPPVSLVVVGAGNDAIPMVQLADVIGWDVRVVDGRNTHARPERFSGACQVLVSKPEKVLEQIPIDERTVFVMMTHNYNYDLAMLRALLPLQVPYIGMLGPRKKLDRMLDELRQGGMDITDTMLEKVFGPTGLEIGAEAAEEIALSIIAEIASVLSGTPGGRLRDKDGAIHTRVQTITGKKNLV